MIKQLLLVTALLAAPVTFAQETAPATPPKAPTFKAHILSRSELDRLLKHPETLLFIDVRRPDEISAIGGLPVYLNVQANQLESSLTWIPKERQIVTISNHAGRAGVAADQLTARGFNVAGAVGVQLYEKAGGTLTKVSPPAAAAGSGGSPK